MENVLFAEKDVVIAAVNVGTGDTLAVDQVIMEFEWVMVNRAIHVMITGQVQGVGFRWWVVNEAKLLGLNGWVRNRLDGSVEAIFSGEDTAINEIIERCWSGPIAAVVTNIKRCITNECFIVFHLFLYRFLYFFYRFQRLVKQSYI